MFVIATAWRQPISKLLHGDHDPRWLHWNICLGASHTYATHVYADIENFTYSPTEISDHASEVRGAWQCPPSKRWSCQASETARFLSLLQNCGFWLATAMLKRLQGPQQPHGKENRTWLGLTTAMRYMNQRRPWSLLKFCPWFKPKMILLLPVRSETFLASGAWSVNTSIMGTGLSKAEACGPNQSLNSSRTWSYSSWSREKDYLGIQFSYGPYVLLTPSLSPVFFPLYPCYS